MVVEIRLKNNKWEKIEGETLDMRVMDGFLTVKEKDESCKVVSVNMFSVDEVSFAVIKESDSTGVIKKYLNK